MAGQYSPALTPNRKPLRHARCACCGNLKDRDPVPWKPGEPMRPCPVCTTAGCTHKWRDQWDKGFDCPSRARGRHMNSRSPSRRGRPLKKAKEG